MRNRYKLTLIPAMLMALVACSAEQDGNNTVTQEPGKSTAVAEESAAPARTNEPVPSSEPASQTAMPEVTAGEIERYENMSISDWLDEDTVVVSKENKDLSKMKLEELSDAYPRSLYLYHLGSREAELLQQQDNAFLGEAVLSSDHRYLLYSEFSLGDPVYHVMDIGSKKTFSITGDPVAGALSAQWADEDTVIGPDYSGGAFTAETSGKLAAVEGLSGEGLVVVRQIKDKIYYTSVSNESLQTMDLATKQKAVLNIDHAGSMIPSPDGEQMLVLQYKDSAMALLLCDTDGGNQKILAQGVELGGVSWSPDQRRIAYSMAADADGTGPSALYIYDLLSDKSAQIAEGTGYLTTSWSPSGKQLAYTEGDGDQNSSSVVQLKD